MDRATAELSTAGLTLMSVIMFCIFLFLYLIPPWCTETTMGTIVQSHCTMHQNPETKDVSMVCVFTVEFEDKEGVKREFKTVSAGNTVFANGLKVMVCYNPSNPNKAALYSMSRLEAAVIFLIGAILSGFFALFFYNQY